MNVYYPHERERSAGCYVTRMKNDRDNRIQVHEGVSRYSDQFRNGFIGSDNGPSLYTTIAPHGCPYASQLHREDLHGSRPTWRARPDKSIQNGKRFNGHQMTSERNEWAHRVEPSHALAYSEQATLSKREVNNSAILDHLSEFWSTVNSGISACSRQSQAAYPKEWLDEDTALCGSIVLDVRSEHLDPEQLTGFTIVESGPLLNLTESSQDCRGDDASATHPDEEDDDGSDDDDDDGDDGDGGGDDDDTRDGLLPSWIDLTPVPGPWSKWSFDSLFFPDHPENDINSPAWCPATTRDQSLLASRRVQDHPDQLQKQEAGFHEVIWQRQIEDWCGFYLGDDWLYGEGTPSPTSGSGIGSDKTPDSYNRTAPRPHSTRIPSRFVRSGIPAGGVLASKQLPVITSNHHSAQPATPSTHDYVSRHVNVTGSRPDSRTFDCIQCSKCYKRQSDYTRHMKAKHDANTNFVYQR